MKKFIAATALVGIISLAGFSMVSAHGNRGGGPGKGYDDCRGYGYCDTWNYNEQDKEKAAAFFQETKEARKQLAVKRSERRALMHQDNPDEKRVAELTGEIFDLQNQLDEKSRAVFGDNMPYGPKRDRGGFGNCGGRGRGPQSF